VSAEGTPLWTRTREDNRVFERLIQGASDAPEAGAFAYVVRHPDPPDYDSAVQRWIEYRAADGTLIRTVPARQDAATISAVLADGSLVHVKYDGTFAVSQVVQQFTPDGGMLTPADLAAGPAAFADPVSLTVAANGEAYVVAALPGVEHVQLLAYAADGTLRWQRSLEASATRLYRSGLDLITRRQGAVVVGGDRVCINRLDSRFVSIFFSVLAPQAPLQCLDRA